MKIKNYKYRKRKVVEIYNYLYYKNEINRLNIDKNKLLELSKKIELKFFIKYGKIKNFSNKTIKNFMIEIINNNKLYLLSYISLNLIKKN